MPAQHLERRGAFPRPVEHRVKEDQVEYLVWLASQKMSCVFMPHVDSTRPRRLEGADAGGNERVDRQAFFQADDAPGWTYRAGGDQGIRGKAQSAIKHGVALFKGGQLASRQVGAAPKQKLEQWITTAV